MKLLSYKSSISILIGGSPEELVGITISLNLPVIGDIIDFGANGTTIEMDATYDCNNVRCLFNVYD